MCIYIYIICYIYINIFTGDTFRRFFNQPNNKDYDPELAKFFGMIAKGEKPDAQKIISVPLAIYMKEKFGLGQDYYGTIHELNL